LNDTWSVSKPRLQIANEWDRKGDWEADTRSRAQGSTNTVRPCRCQDLGLYCRHSSAYLKKLDSKNHWLAPFDELNILFELFLAQKKPTQKVTGGQE